MVLALIALAIILLPTGWNEVEVSFISRDLQEETTYSFLLPEGYKQMIADPGEGGRKTIYFLYPSGATFYITNDANVHPNARALRNIEYDWDISGLPTDHYLVDNELLADPSIHQEYSIPDKTDYSGHSFRSRWWRDIQTYEISYGYLQASKKWKNLFEQVIDSIKMTRKESGVIL